MQINKNAATKNVTYTWKYEYFVFSMWSQKKPL